jgi:hypothetical protein
MEGQEGEAWPVEEHEVWVVKLASMLLKSGKHVGV